MYTCETQALIRQRLARLTDLILVFCPQHKWSSSLGKSKAENEDQLDFVVQRDSGCHIMNQFLRVWLYHSRHMLFRFSVYLSRTTNITEVLPVWTKVKPRYEEVLHCQRRHESGDCFWPHLPTGGHLITMSRFWDIKVEVVGVVLMHPRWGV